MDLLNKVLLGQLLLSLKGTERRRYWLVRVGGTSHLSLIENVWKPIDYELSDPFHQRRSRGMLVYRLFERIYRSLVSKRIGKQISVDRVTKKIPHLNPI